MKILDRYIVRQFVVTSLFSLVAIIVIFIVIDGMEHLDDFIDRDADATVIGLYYLYFMPEIIKLITPVAMLLASLFVTARLSTQNELTATKTAGVSLYRFMVPYLVVAVMVSLASVYFNGWIVPLANKKKFTIERVYLQKNVVSGSSANIYFQDSATRILTIGYFDDSRNLASRVSIQDFSDTNMTIMTHRVDAMSMQWDTTARRWILENGTERWFGGNRETMQTFETEVAGRLNFDANDLRKKQ
ncbi:MAG: LptF/LptG family permease, partial [Ignavibacteria bacterium]|nr:LptF/LptG family permease [Ignavibacteria bacterium]